MRCLVTGADGFLGAHLVQRLQAAGHEVTGAALSRKGETSLDALGVKCRVEYGDITDAAYVERLVNATEAEWVFHLAAVSIVRIAEANPSRAIRTNVLGTLNVLEACRRQPTVKAVLVASSDKAYGDQGGVPYTEDMPLKPTGAYEVSKAQADTLALLYGREYGLPVTVARCANLFGPGDLNWSRLVPNSCRRAARGEPPQVYPSAWTMRREWIAVEDAADAYAFLAEYGVRGQAYNVGTGSVYTAGAIAGRIAKFAGVSEPVESAIAPAYEIPAQALDSTKLSALGWEARRCVPDELKRAVAWYRGWLA